MSQYEMIKIAASDQYIYSDRINKDLYTQPRGYIAFKGPGLITSAIQPVWIMLQAIMVGLLIGPVHGVAIIRLPIFAAQFAPLKIILRQCCSHHISRSAYFWRKQRGAFQYNA